MNLNESMFATEADYWKVRSHLNESIVADVAKELGCERDNESIIEKIAELKEEAALGRAVRKEIAGLEAKREAGEILSDTEDDWLNSLQGLAAGLMEVEK